MNLTDAISVHVTWKLALHHAVRTGVATNLDPALLGRNDRCELGLWLARPTTRFEGLEELRDLHGRFHAVAGALIHRIQDHGSGAATRDLEAELAELSARLVVRLGATAQALDP